MDAKLTYEQKLKAAELAVTSLEKDLGKGIIFTGNTEIQDVDVVPTNNFKLDLALGVGGIPTKRISIIEGPEGLGKTLIGLNLVAQCQANGGLAAYIDVENALDPLWAIRNGVKWSDLHISQPDSAEQALTILRRLVNSKAYDLIIVDSIAAMATDAEIAGEIGDAHVAGLARLMSQSLRIMKGEIARSDCAVVFMNQVRENINTMGMGPKTTSPGGRAPKFYASVRIELARIEQIKDNASGELLGVVIQAKILKNKVAPPFKVVRYPVMHGKGFDNEDMIIDLAKKFGHVMASGAFFYTVDKDGVKGDKPFGQGKAKASQYLRENLDFRNDLVKKVTDSYKREQGYFDMPENFFEEEAAEEDEEALADV